jgi:hypothetical protein
LAQYNYIFGILMILLVVNGIIGFYVILGLIVAVVRCTQQEFRTMSKFIRDEYTAGKDFAKGEYVALKNFSVGEFDQLKQAITFYMRVMMICNIVATSTGVLSLFKTNTTTLAMGSMNPQGFRKDTNRAGMFFAGFLSLGMILMAPIFGAKKAVAWITPLLDMLKRLPYITWFIDYMNKWWAGEVDFDDLPQDDAEFREALHILNEDDVINDAFAEAKYEKKLKEVAKLRDHLKKRDQADDAGSTSSDSDSDHKAAVAKRQAAVLYVFKKEDEVYKIVNVKTKEQSLAAKEQFYRICENMWTKSGCGPIIYEGKSYDWSYNLYKHMGILEYCDPDIVMDPDQPTGDSGETSPNKGELDNAVALDYVSEPIQISRSIEILEIDEACDEVNPPPMPVPTAAEISACCNDIQPSWFAQPSIFDSDGAQVMVRCPSLSESANVAVAPFVTVGPVVEIPRALPIKDTRVVKIEEQEQGPYVCSACGHNHNLMFWNFCETCGLAQSSQGLDPRAGINMIIPADEPVTITMKKGKSPNSLFKKKEKQAVKRAVRSAHKSEKPDVLEIEDSNDMHETAKLTGYLRPQGGPEEEMLAAQEKIAQDKVQLRADMKRLEELERLAKVKEASEARRKKFFEGLETTNPEEGSWAEFGSDVWYLFSSTFEWFFPDDTHEPKHRFGNPSISEIIETKPKSWLAWIWEEICLTPEHLRQCYMPKMSDIFEDVQYVHSTVNIDPLGNVKNTPKNVPQHLYNKSSLYRQVVNNWLIFWERHRMKLIKVFLLTAALRLIVIPTVFPRPSADEEEAELSISTQKKGKARRRRGMYTGYNLKKGKKYTIQQSGAGEPKDDQFEEPSDDEYEEYEDQYVPWGGEVTRTHVGKNKRRPNKRSLEPHATPQKPEAPAVRKAHEPRYRNLISKSKKNFPYKPSDVEVFLSDASKAFGKSIMKPQAFNTNNLTPGVFKFYRVLHDGTLEYACTSTHIGNKMWVVLHSLSEDFSISYRAVNHVHTINFKAEDMHVFGEQLATFPMNGFPSPFKAGSLKVLVDASIVTVFGYGNGTANKPDSIVGFASPAGWCNAPTRNGDCTSPVLDVDGKIVGFWTHGDEKTNFGRFETVTEEMISYAKSGFDVLHTGLDFQLRPPSR